MKATLTAACALALAASIAFPASARSAADPGEVLVEHHPKLANWTVDSAGFAAKLKGQAKGPVAKADTDRASVFRPVAPCRLFDTRGFPAALAVPGPFAANSTTNIAAAGNCGIPTNGYVVGLSVAISIQNLTPSSGGYVATQQQGTPVNAINTVLNIGAEWAGTTANIPIPNGSGDFSVFVANSTTHVIIDVNGYYQDLDSLDIGLQELDVNGSNAGDIVGIAQAGTGAALAISASNGTALRINSGAVRASGAGVGTNTFATIHEVNTAGAFGAGGTLCGVGFPSYTVIDNTLANGDPDAILLITPRRNNTTSTHADYAVEAYYYAAGSCSASSAAHWMIHRVDGTPHADTAQFNVLIIKP